jgi:hypothetical protein
MRKVLLNTLILALFNKISMGAIGTSTLDTTLSFDVGKDQSHEMELSTDELLVTVDLRASGNVRVDGSSCFAGKTIMTTSHPLTVDSTIYWVDMEKAGGDVWLLIPEANTMPGRNLHIKKSSHQHELHLIPTDCRIEGQTRISKTDTETTISPSLQLWSHSGNWHIINNNGTISSSNHYLWTLSDNLIAFWDFDQEDKNQNII